MGDQFSIHRHDHASGDHFFADSHAARLRASAGNVGIPNVGQHIAGKLWALEDEEIRSKSDIDLLSHILEPILYADAPRIAHSLLEKYGSLAELTFGSRSMRQSKDEKFALTFISELHELTKRALKERLVQAPILSDWKLLHNYPLSIIAYMPTECFRVLYLNTKNMLIQDEIQGEGSIDTAPCYPRRVVHCALDLGQLH